VAFRKHRELQLKNGSEIGVGGVALHAVLSNRSFIDFLQYLIDIRFISELSVRFFTKVNAY